MKSVFSVLLALLCLLTAGCSLLPDTSDGSSADGGATTTTTTATSAFISEARAVEIAEQHWSIRSGDRAPETGFIMTVTVMESPTADNPVYRMAFQWLVEVDGQPSNYSLLDTVRIDAKTGEIINPEAG